MSTNLVSIKRLGILLIGILALCMTFGMASKAYAEDYPLIVGGVQVTTENADWIDVPGESGWVSYDQSTNTLNLEQACISSYYAKSTGTGAYDSYSPKIYYGIYAEGDLNINVSGVCKSSYAIYTGGDLNISGDGTLDIALKAYDSYGSYNSVALECADLNLAEESNLYLKPDKVIGAYGLKANAVTVDGNLVAECDAIQQATAIKCGSCTVSDTGCITADAKKRENITAGWSIGLMCSRLTCAGMMNVTATNGIVQNIGILATGIRFLNGSEVLINTYAGNEDKQWQAISCETISCEKYALVAGGPDEKNMKALTPSSIGTNRCLYIGNDLAGHVTKALKSNTITASSITKSSSAAAQSFTIKAACKGGAKLSYSSNSSSIWVSSTGKVTIPAKYVGTATITIKSAQTADYKAATKKITLKVNLKKTSLSSAKRTGKTKMKLTWKANGAGTGYEIKYAKGSSFKNAKTVKISSYKTASRTIKNLKAKKKYYVKMRTVKKTSSKTYYSAWSSVKTVKVK